ncbi:MAG TPA: cyanophycinase [Bacteroidales bacterium]|nr:cyanophycinase [Bacteroidales bacterium]
MNIPKGKLIPIGGHEAKSDAPREDQHIDFKNGVLKDIIREIRGNHPSIVVVPIASKSQEEMIRIYRDAFARLDLKIDAIIANTKKDLDDKGSLKKLTESDGIFISGGDQVKLKDMLMNTEFLRILRSRYENENFTIAGTSAGAMILSEHMIYSGASEGSVIKGLIKLNGGFSFIPNTIIDTHFLNRGRFARLIEATIQKPDCVGIGLSEDTALVITKGNEMRAIGSGTVTIFESDRTKNSNYSRIADKEPVFIENIRMHILAEGVAYLIKSRKFRLLE